MKTRHFAILAHAIPLVWILAACTAHTPTASDPALSPVVAGGTTIATSLAVNAYPGAAPFVEMAAGAIRQISAERPPTPDQLNAYLAIFKVAADRLAAKAGASAVADVDRFFAAVQSDYAKFFASKIVTATEAKLPLVEQFAEAVEKGA